MAADFPASLLALSLKASATDVQDVNDLACSDSQARQTEAVVATSSSISGDASPSLENCSQTCSPGVVVNSIFASSPMDGQLQGGGGPTDSAPVLHLSLLAGQHQYEQQQQQQHDNSQLPLLQPALGDPQDGEPQLQPQDGQDGQGQQDGPPGTKPQICFDFTKGMCSRGDKCKYSHDLATIVTFNSKEKGICFDYLRNQCHRGLLCRFSHDLSNIAQQCQVYNGTATRGKTGAICYDFVKGVCQRGNDCRYSHDLSLIARTARGGGIGTKAGEVCYDYLRGRCNRGPSCKYSHNISFLSTPGSFIPGGDGEGGDMSLSDQQAAAIEALEAAAAMGQQQHAAMMAVAAGGGDVGQHATAPLPMMGESHHHHHHNSQHVGSAGSGYSSSLAMNGGGGHGGGGGGSNHNNNNNSAFCGSAPSTISPFGSSPYNGGGSGDGSGGHSLAMNRQRSAGYGGGGGGRTHQSLMQHHGGRDHGGNSSGGGGMGGSLPPHVGQGRSLTSSLSSDYGNLRHSNAGGVPLDLPMPGDHMTAQLPMPPGSWGSGGGGGGVSSASAAAAARQMAHVAAMNGYSPHQFQQAVKAMTAGGGTGMAGQMAGQHNAYAAPSASLPPLAPMSMKAPAAPPAGLPHMYNSGNGNGNPVHGSMCAGGTGGDLYRGDAAVAAALSHQVQASALLRAQSAPPSAVNPASAGGGPPELQAFLSGLQQDNPELLAHLAAAAQAHAMHVQAAAHAHAAQVAHHVAHQAVQQRQQQPPSQQQQQQHRVSAPGGKHMASLASAPQPIPNNRHHNGIPNGPTSYTEGYQLGGGRGTLLAPHSHGDATNPANMSPEMLPMLKQIWNK